MAIKINISGVSMRGNTELLNGLEIQGENNTDISVNQSAISGKSQILNDVNISENSSADIEIENSEMKENARVLNGLEVENGQVNVELRDVSLGEGVEFMDGRKFTEKTSHQQTSKEADEQHTTEKTTKTSDKKDGLLKRVLKSILKSENVEEHTEVRHSQKSYRNFEDEISRGGKLRNLDTSEALRSTEKAAKELRREAKSKENIRE